MSFKRLFSGHHGHKHNSQNQSNDKTDSMVQQSTPFRMVFPPDVEGQLPLRIGSAESEPLPLIERRPIPSPLVRWIHSADRHVSSSSNQENGSALNQLAPSEHTPLLQQYHHLSINISISLPATLSAGNSTFPSPTQQPLRFRELVTNVIPALVRAAVLTLVTASRLSFLIVVILIICLTILGNLGLYMFPLLCFFERILWQDDTMGFCGRGFRATC